MCIKAREKDTRNAQGFFKGKKDCLEEGGDEGEIVLGRRKDMRREWKEEDLRWESRGGSCRVLVCCKYAVVEQLSVTSRQR